MAATADSLDDPGLAGKTRYDRCLSLVQRNASSAYEAAVAWQDGDGGAASAHCEAMALVLLRRYAEAAQKLDLLGHDRNVETGQERATLYDQAGNAWLLAGQTMKADDSFTNALSLMPNDPDILSDRARGRGARKDWAGAEKDLTAVLRTDPNRADLLVLRASARHALGRKQDARADVDQALNVYRDYPDALLMRGEMKAEAGDGAGALADWQRTAAAQPNSAAAKAAKAHIADMQTQPAKK
ncbi:MAG TPA: hypothetical protein VGF56_01090 [Rhizomicrobium sp.]